MAREYTLIHDYFNFVPLQGVQPITPTYHPYDPHSASASEAPGYELTIGGGGGVGGAGGSCSAAGAVVAAHVPQQAQMQPSRTQRQDPHKRKNSDSQYSDSYDNMSGCEVQLTPSDATSQPNTMPRKRKTSSYGNGSVYDDGATEDARSIRSLPDKKQNHSEIEKRRRDKMNNYITELSAMIPMCGAMARKLDKLTVLRMAVQHLRSVRGALSACPLSARPRPAFLSERELNELILHAAQDCFLLVVGCDRGRLLYVSTSVQKMLHYDQTELLGQSLFDILHPKDVAKVKEQLSSSDLNPRERLIDAKTMLPVKADVVAGASRLCPGARRSFFCRIKCKATVDAVPTSVQIKDETEPSSKLKKKQNEKKYCVVQFTGYLKSWASAGMSESPMNTNDGSDDNDDCNLRCLVAVGRALPDLVPALYTCPRPPPIRQLQYVSRHAPDGKFLFVDQRVTTALGFLPQELLGTSLYEYVNGPELGVVAGTHKTALLSREPLYTPPYSFRRKDGSLAKIQTHFKTFKNPWTKDVECLVANNTIVSDSHGMSNLGPSNSSYDIYNQKPDMEMQRLIESQVESHKIGSAIVEDALRRSSTEYSPDVTADLFQDVVFNQQWPLKTNVLYEQATLVDNMLGADSYDSVRNNVSLSAAGGQNSPPPSSSEHMQGTPPSASPPLPPLGLDGNGEAAMAVIMSLLEADAGLGGPVNFSGLPWPLP